MTIFYNIIRKDYMDRYATALMASEYRVAPPCPSCRLSYRERIPPFTIEWVYGSNIVADFTWPQGLENQIVSDGVRSTLVSKKLTGIDFEPIVMFQKPGLKVPRKESKSKTRVWLPYKGLPLSRLVVTSECALDLQASGRSLETECSKCGRNRMHVADKNAPLVGKCGSWDGADIFRINEMGGLVFVVQRVAQLLENCGFTNVQYKERGYIQGNCSPLYEKCE